MGVGGANVVTEHGPHEPRQCGLKNGNPSGDPASAPRCGANTRRGTPCQCPAMRGKRRCRLHGGLSTGPRTPEGRERCRQARLKSGYWSAEARAERRLVREAMRQFKKLCETLDENT